MKNESITMDAAFNELQNFVLKNQNNKNVISAIKQAQQEYPIIKTVTDGKDKKGL